MSIEEVAERSSAEKQKFIKEFEMLPTHILVGPSEMSALTSGKPKKVEERHLWILGMRVVATTRDGIRAGILSK